MADPLEIAAWGSVGTMVITGLALVGSLIYRLGRASRDLEALVARAQRFEDRLNELQRYVDRRHAMVSRGAGIGPWRETVTAPRRPATGDIKEDDQPEHDHDERGE